jgi:TPR repeat protein
MKTIEELTELAEAGDTKSMNILWCIYFTGRYCDYENIQDFGMALYYAVKSSSLCNKMGYYNMAIHFIFGKGVEESEDMAIFYLNQASDLGMEDADFTLGQIYQNRKTPDHRMAFHFFSKHNPLKTMDYVNLKSCLSYMAK